jgi:hypothetical protein
VILVRVTTAATLLAIDQSVVCHASVSLACVGSIFALRTSICFVHSLVG